MAAALPAPPLRRYIDRYWWWDAPLGSAGTYAPVLPGTGAELLVHLGQPLRRGDGGGAFPDDAHVLCVRSRAIHLAPSPDVRFVAVRFRAGALRHFSPAPITELADVAPSATDLWGANGATLSDEIRGAAGPAQQIAALDRFLLTALERWRQADTRPDRAARILYAARGKLRVDALAAELRLTRRQLERTFKRALGVSPKAFDAMARLQTTVRAVVTAGRTDYLASALDAGYFDQAHFVHSFRRITGHTPAPYFKAAQNGAHFYKPSLRPTAMEPLTTA